MEWVVTAWGFRWVFSWMVKCGWRCAFGAMRDGCVDASHGPRPESGRERRLQSPGRTGANKDMGKG